MVGWPARVEKVLLEIREFFDSRGHLSMSNGLLTYDDCIVIPSDMRDTGSHSHRSPGYNKVP